MTKTQINIELEPEFVAVLDAMAGKALRRQSVARMLLIAALEAVQENGGRVHLPPRLRVNDDSNYSPITFRINEPKHEKRK